MSKCETCENEAGMFVQCENCRNKSYGEVDVVNEILEIEELRYRNHVQAKRIDSLLEQNKKLEVMIDQQHESINEHLITIALHGEDNRQLKQECQSLSDENKARWQTEKALTELLYSVASALAVDIVVDRTHRERNAIIRVLVKRVINALKADGLEGLDDIPF